MALGSKYRLEEFAEVFDLRDSDGRPFLLIGGQAVNYWAGRYRSIEPSLELFQSERAKIRGSWGFSTARPLSPRVQKSSPNRRSEGWKPKGAIRSLPAVTCFTGQVFLDALDLAALDFIGTVWLSGVRSAFTGSFLLGETVVNNAKNASKPRKRWSVPIAQMDRATVS